MSKGLTRMAAIWCRDPMFAAWMSEIGEQPFTCDQAPEFIRIVCQIESRRQLDTDTVAAALFHLHIRRPFLEWRQSQVQEA